MSSEIYFWVTSVCLTRQLDISIKTNDFHIATIFVRTTQIKFSEKGHKKIFVFQMLDTNLSIGCHGFCYVFKLVSLHYSLGLPLFEDGTVSAYGIAESW